MVDYNMKLLKFIKQVFACINTVGGFTKFLFIKDREKLRLITWYMTFMSMKSVPSVSK